MSGIIEPNYYLYVAVARLLRGCCVAAAWLLRLA
jgi:hypothetical protein